MAHCRRKFFEALPVEHKKTMKLLDIDSAEAIKELEISQGGIWKSTFLRRLELLTAIRCSIWNGNSKIYPLKNEKQTIRTESANMGLFL